MYRTRASIDYVVVDSEKSIPKGIEERDQISSEEEVDEMGNKGDPFRVVKWYYPDLSGHNAEAILRTHKIEGSYILRSIIPKAAHSRARDLPPMREYALSVWHGGRTWQFRVEYVKELGQVRFGLKTYENVVEFEIKVRKGYQLSNGTYTLYLKKPIPNIAEPSITKEKHFEHFGISEGLNLPVHRSEQLSYEVHNGYLTKQGHVVKSWKRRWFALKKNTLSYYKTNKSEESAINTIDLSTIEKLIENDHNYKQRYCFTIVARDGYKLTMSAENETEYKRWINKLDRIVKMNENK